MFGKNTVHSWSVRAVRKMFLNNTGKILAIHCIYIRRNKWKKSGKDTGNVRKCFPPMYHRMVSAWFPFAFRMFSVYFQNRPNTSRTLTSLFVCFPNVLRTRRIDRMQQELDAYFQNVFRTYRMLMEYFPNTSWIQIDATFGRSMNIILNMHTKF